MTSQERHGRQRAKEIAAAIRLEVAYKRETTSCRKRTFTKQGAKEAMKAMRAHGADGDLAPYRCPDCTDWHLGHPTPLNKLQKRGLIQQREAMA